MASLSRGQTYGSTETITNVKLHNLVDLGTVTGIVNADISAGAAIVYSKLSMAGSIVNADISASAAIAYSKLNLTGAILNADLAGSIADSKLSQITTASKVHGSSITGLASVPSGAGIVPIANLASGTPTGLKFIRDDSTLQVPPNFSNVLFSFAGSTTNVGFLGASSTLTPSSIAPTYAFWSTVAGAESNWTTVIATKWTKISGVSTATIYAQIWQSNSNTAQLKVNIGSANGNVSGTSSQTTPEWNNFTIDVSGLSNGTTYDVTIQLSNNNNNGQNINLGSIIAFGS